MISVDVVVPVHGKWALTAQCLLDLRAQTIEHRVILVDDKSPDDTLEQVARHFPEVDVVALEVNCGFAVACNRGIAAGNGEIVVLLNNDVEAAPTLLEEIVRPFIDNPSVGSAATLLLRPDGRVDSFGIFADPTLAGFARCHGARLAATSTALPQLLGPCGAAAAYRRAALEMVGGFDEGFLMYSEDLELALRLRAAGWDCAESPLSRGVHLGGATTKNGSARQRYMAGYGRGYVLRRYDVVASTMSARTLATESLVCLAGLVLFRDLADTRGRIGGWRAARSAPKRARPKVGPDPRIGFLQSLQLRRPGRVVNETVANPQD